MREKTQGTSNKYCGLDTQQDKSTADDLKIYVHQQETKYCPMRYRAADFVDHKPVCQKSGTQRPPSLETIIRDQIKKQEEGQDTIQSAAMKNLFGTG